jgi:phage gp45-like
MSAAIDARIAALERRVAELTRLVGTPPTLAKSTLPVNDLGNVQQIQAQLDALSWRDGIDVLYNYGFTGSPPIGADLHLAFIGGSRSKPVVVASAHQTYRLRGLAVGDAALYDSRGVSIWLTASGPVVTCAGLPMTVTGDLRVTGQVWAGYGSGDQVGLQTHRHGTGSAAAGTVPPTAGI